MRNVFGEKVYYPEDPAADPSNFYSMPPVVTVEQAWAQPGATQERLPDGSVPGLVTSISNLVRSLFGRQINQAVDHALNPNGYEVYPAYQPVEEPMPAWVVPVVAVVGATVLVALVRGGGRRKRRS